MSAPAYHNDTLPAYSSTPPSYRPSVGCYGIALMKSEFSSPYHYNNSKRSWKPVLLEINSTQLNVYDLKLEKRLLNLIKALYHNENYLEEIMDEIVNGGLRKETDFFDDIYSGDAYEPNDLDASVVDSATSLLRAKLRKSKFATSIAKDLQEYHSTIKENGMLFEPTTNHAEYLAFSAKFRGPLLQQLTLQNLNFGEAPSLADYLSNEKKTSKLESLATMVKYTNVLRARIELKQCLFQFWSFYGMVQWYTHFGIARDLLVSIDDRKLAKVRTIPSRYTRWSEVEAAAAEAAAAAISGDALATAVSAGSSSSNLVLDRDTKDAASFTSSSSVFDRSRSSSVLSGFSTTSSTSSHEKTYANCKLVSMEEYYTSLEKDYISSCIPKLNTFQKWTGVNVTISNFQKYLNPNQLEELKEAGGSKRLSLFINPNKLEETAFPRIFRKKQVAINSGECRQFIIHQHGLVSTC